MAVVLDVGKIEGQTLILDFLLFVSFIAHTHFRIQLHNFLLAIAAPSRRARAPVPGICGWTRHAEAAVGAGHDVFSPDEFGEGDDAIGYQFRVLDKVGGVYKLRSGLAMQQIRSEARAG
jgi:hypothetical protein